MVGDKEKAKYLEQITRIEFEAVESPQFILRPRVLLFGTHLTWPSKNAKGSAILSRLAIQHASVAPGHPAPCLGTYLGRHLLSG